MYSRPNPGQPGFNPMPSHAGPQPGQPGFNPIPQQPQYPGNGYAPTYPPQNTPGVPSYAPPPMPGPMPTGGAPVSFFHGQRVNIRLANGKYLRANPDGDFDGNADRPGDWERYTLEQQGNNLFALRTFHNKLACWDNGSKRFDVRDQAGEWERFEFQPAGNGGYFFYCPAHRCYINLVNGWLGSFSDPRQAQPVFVTVSNGGGGVAPQPFVPPPPQPFVPPQPIAPAGGPVSFFHGQRVNIRLANGKYLRANPDGDFDGNADRPGDWERYTLEQQGNNLFALRTFHNKLACWDNGSKRFDVRDQAGEWERFEFQPAGNGGYFFYCPAHRCYINLVNGWLGSFSDPRQAQPVFVTVSNGGGGVAPQPFVPPPPQPFVPPPPQPFQGVRPGLYYIRNAHSKLLHVDFYFVSQAVGFEPDRRILVEAQPSQGPNRYALRNVTSGKVLCFDSSGRIESRDQIGPWEVAEFRPVPGVPGKFFIFNPAQNKYLRCSDSGAVDQSPVGQIWEQFEFLAA